MAAQNLQLAALDFVLIFEEPARRRTRNVRSVFIKRAPMARTHEQPRFLKPAHRAAEMGAIDRENLERLRVHPAHPTWNFSGVPVPRLADRVAIDGQARLAFRKFVEGPE